MLNIFRSHNRTDDDDIAFFKPKKCSGCSGQLQSANIDNIIIKNPLRKEEAIVCCAFHTFEVVH